MAGIPYTRWYGEGTAAFTKGTTTVTGTNTFWVSAGIKAGDIFVDENRNIYEITSVNDSTSLTLGSSYTGETGSGKSYSIIRTFNATMTASLASQIATLLSEFEKRYDLDMQTIKGKSAYDIAKDNGFTGTQSEWVSSLSAYGVAVSQGYQGTITDWLESLKAAGEWTLARETLTGHASDITALQALTASQGTAISTLQADTDPFRFHTSVTHNAIVRGKNLGSVITDEQLAAIRDGTYKDIYPGDYWLINGRKYIVVHLDTINTNIHDAASSYRNLILWSANNGYMSTYGSTIADGFVGSNWYVNKWDAITERIVGDLGEAHIQDSTKEKQEAYLTMSTAVGENGVITGLMTVSGLQIGPICVHNIWGNLYPFDKRLADALQQQVSGHRITQYAYFRHMGTRGIRQAEWENYMTDSYILGTKYISFRGGRTGYHFANAQSEIKPLIVLTSAE